GGLMLLSRRYVSAVHSGEPCECTWPRGFLGESSTGRVVRLSKLGGGNLRDDGCGVRVSLADAFFTINQLSNRLKVRAGKRRIRSCSTLPLLLQGPSCLADRRIQRRRSAARGRNRDCLP